MTTERKAAVMGTDYKTRVEAGMAWLDDNAPGWERKIDLATFDIANGCNCVLGQVFAHKSGLYVSGFAYGLGDLQPGEAWTLGFADLSRNYPPLEAEWRTAIKARFDTGVLSDDVAEVRPA